MTLTLLLLSVSIVGLLAIATSAATWGTLPWLAKFGYTMPPRREIFFWLGVGVLPLVVGGSLLAISMLSAFNLSADHCLDHGRHHLHLCWRHSEGHAGISLLILCGLFAFKALEGCTAAWRGILLGTKTSSHLKQASIARQDFMVFESQAPQAFVLGAWRPTLHVSSALLSLSPSIVEPVLAHERAHARHYDFLWRALFPLFALGHFSGVSKELCSKLVTAQEKAADAVAAQSLENPLLVAEAIIALSAAKHVPRLGLGFTHGDTVVRVKALLGLTPPPQKWPLNLAMVTALFTLLFTLRFHSSVHHILEHVLGFLS